jgi:hypothetical protein
MVETLVLNRCGLVQPVLRTLCTKVALWSVFFCMFGAHFLFYRNDWKETRGHVPSSFAFATRNSSHRDQFGKLNFFSTFFVFLFFCCVWLQNLSISTNLLLTCVCVCVCSDIYITCYCDKYASFVLCVFFLFFCFFVFVVFVHTHEIDKENTKRNTNSYSFRNVTFKVNTTILV